MIIDEKARDAISEKMTDGTYEFESPPCGICGGEDFELIADKDRYGLDNPVVICRDCGLIQLNPRMTAESYRRFYRDDYRTLYTGNKTVIKHFEFLAHVGKRIMKFAKKYGRLRRGAKVLEVGCSSGGILQTFKTRGYDVTGVDYDRDRVAFGMRRGLNLIEGDIFSAEGKFDLIIYSHVLEHVLDLKKELKQVSKLLNPKGYLFLDLPDMSYWLAQNNFLPCLQNAHTYYFTPRTLSNVLEMSGFSRVAIQANRTKSFMTLWRMGEPSDNIESDYQDMKSLL
jgi:2-polyprenyl-3-methyl-5-hydroxy-6-metoxy-1,4-benzoquinol methylase